MTWDPHAMARVVDAARRQQQPSAGPDSMMEDNSGIDAAETEGLGATTTPDPKPTQDRLAIGDTVEVFSRSQDAWCVATVLQEKPDGQTILVRGIYMGQTMKKWVARDDGEAVRRPTRTADFDPARAGESAVCNHNNDACVWSYSEIC